MNNILAWALRHNISSAAIDDLRAEFGLISTDPEPCSASIKSEAGAQSRVRLEASMKGLRLWRNNLGAVIDSRGNYIRYGLANDSQSMNASIKSSDLIGIRPVTLPDGRLIGQFVAREIKAPGWEYSGTEREKAQLKFLELVASFGGDAKFATGEGTL